jgi:hypothetical protein
MTRSELLFALTTPSIAVILEKLRIPSDEYLAAKAEDRRKRAGLPTAAADMIREMSKGAVSMSSAAPTMVSFVISGFVLLNDSVDAALYDFFWLLATIVLVLIFLRLLNRFDPYELATTRMPLPFKIRGHRTMPRTWANFITWMIYGINFTLILLALLVFFGQLPHLHTG